MSNNITIDHCVCVSGDYDETCPEIASLSDSVKAVIKQQCENIQLFISHGNKVGAFKTNVTDPDTGNVYELLFSNPQPCCK